jgi:hypothetical protein
MSENLTYGVKKRGVLKTPLFLKPKKLSHEEHVLNKFDIFCFLDT